MTKAARELNVQVPGEVAAPTEAPAIEQATEQPEPAPTPVEEPAKPKVKTNVKAPLTKADYAKMRADDINPKALAAPVLSLDGWVVPDLPAPATINKQ